MHNKEIENKVIKILSENTRNKYSLKELSKILKIKKHKYKELVHTLYNLLKEGRIELKNKKYYIKKYVKKEKKIKTGVFEGIFDASALSRDKSFAFVICEDFDVFVSSEDIKNSFDGDTVLVEVYQQRGKKRYGKILKIIKRKRDKIVGTIFRYKSKDILIPDNKKIHKDFKIVKTEQTYKTGDKAILKVDYWGNFEEGLLPYGKIEKILGKSGDPDVEILATIASMDLPLEFPKPVLKELKYINAKIEPKDIENRTDLRHLTTFTIDPESAKDYDDAVSLFDTGNGYILYVHIADVAHYVKPNGKLFKEAYNRGNSYYFPKMVIPMLPEKISNKICSLRPNEEKLAITVETHFDKDAAIIKQKVYESIIESDTRLTYKQVDELFETHKSNEIDPDIQTVLFEMRELSKKLTKKMIKRGYLSFYLPESEYFFDNKGQITDIKYSSETESHKLIENFMLIANEFIAKKLSYHHTIYRIHELPDLNKVEEIRLLLLNYGIKTKSNKDMNKMFQDILKALPNHTYHIVFDRKILRSLKKAKYHTKNTGHFALSIPVYTHFTSPIRRFCDLVIHTQIKDFLKKAPYRFEKSELIDFAKQATERENLADESEKEIDKKYKLIFMKTKLGEVYEGVITNIISTGIIVELEKYPISGIIPNSMLPEDRYTYYQNTMMLLGQRSGRVFKLTQKVKVLVAKVDNDIIFKMIYDNSL